MAIQLRGMSRRAGATAAVVLAATIGWRMAHPRSTLAADGRDPAWDARVRRTAATGKPAVLLFTADWCSACQSMRAGAMSDPAVAAELESAHTLIIVDLSKPTAADQSRAEQFAVDGLPTLIRFDADGHETGRVHAVPAAVLLKVLQDR